MRVRTTGLASITVVLLTSLLTTITLPARALADADPASDYLLSQSVFYPYAPPPSPALQRGVQEALRRLQARGLNLKVAIVAVAADLGAVSNLFGAPQRYAQFLDREISFNTRQPLLVVMPSGYGTINAGPANALAGSPVDASHGSDGLARSAIGAVVRLARATGRPIAAPPIASAAGGSRRSAASWIAFAVPALAVLVVAALSTVSQRRRRRDAGT